MLKVYYTVYHRQSMKTIKDYLSKVDLVLFLYDTWYKDISQVCPRHHNLAGSAIEHTDIQSLIEAVNREGILLINEGKIVEW